MVINIGRYKDSDTGTEVEMNIERATDFRCRYEFVAHQELELRDMELSQSLAGGSHHQNLCRSYSLWVRKIYRSLKVWIGLVKRLSSCNFAAMSMRVMKVTCLKRLTRCKWN